jgi:hypothetical protein
LLAHGRWFSPGSPASSTTKTGRHDIAEILMKVALNTKNQIKSNYNRVSSNLQRRNKSVKGASEISYYYDFRMIFFQFVL